jgi:3-hydroxyisobutyrate dehydrogenase-like beta-hydroxyacid dehydrogenase
MKVGFIGLGNMGQPIASNLLRAGHNLTVYNRTLQAAEPLRQLGASVAKSPAEAAQAADVLITMLSDDAAVESVLFGSDDIRGAFNGLTRDAIHISMSTISVALSQRLAEAHTTAGQTYLAAPVFGRPEAAAQAALWIVAAGDIQQVERCRPLLEATGQGVFYVGAEAWMANLVKLTGNFMIAATLETMGEAFALMQKSGVAPEQFLEIVNTALFKSPLYQNYGSLIVQERYEPAGFKLHLGLKDVRLALSAAESMAVPLPLASLIRDHFLTAIAHGQADIDWAGLAQVSARNAGLDQLNSVEEQ